MHRFDKGWLSGMVSESRSDAIHVRLQNRLRDVQVAPELPQKLFLLDQAVGVFGEITENGKRLALQPNHCTATPQTLIPQVDTATCKLEKGPRIRARLLHL
jgi:hypothetical protein